jgi:uncharacterized protein YdeI (YjbR/CyaY-like superfamily)
MKKIACRDASIHPNRSLSMGKNAQIDNYIAKSAPFARPILKQIRQAIHAASDDIEETLKWNIPHFVYSGKILCGLAAFKQHCRLHFWHSGVKALVKKQPKGEQTFGQFGRITKFADLPKKAELTRLVSAAIELTDQGVKSAPRQKPKPKKPLVVPRELTAALSKNKKTLAAFNKLSPSHQREYAEWIGEAKRDETKQKRLQTAIKWSAEGKSLNWKYQRK